MLKVAITVFMLVGSLSMGAFASERLEDDFSSDPFTGERWTAQGGEVAWNTEGFVEISKTGQAGIIRSKGHIVVKPGQFVEAALYAKTMDATGETYFEIEWLQSDKVVGQLKGGSPYERIVWRPNSISGTRGWLYMGARGFVPEGVDGARVALRSDNNSGIAQFKNIELRIVPRSEVEGIMDKNHVKIDPSTLTSDDYVQVKDGHLWYKGKRFRVWLGQGGLERLTHSDIDRNVARMLWHGFNGFRCLWWKDEVSSDYTPGDHSLWDQRDYLIATMGQQGLFFWCDLLNSCQIRPERVDVIDDPATVDEWQAAVKQMCGNNEFHNVRNFLPIAWDERSQKIYHNYMKQVLEHRNPYNGLTYSEDPTFFCWELTNEEWWIMRILWGNHLSLPTFFQKGLYEKWNSWLSEKYGSDEALIAAWNGLLEGESLDSGSVMLIPLLGDKDASDMAKALGLGVKYEKISLGPKDFSEARGKDVIEFIVNLHLDYKNEAARIFKSIGRPGIGSSIVPLVYDTGYSGAVLPLYKHSFADATAVGVYADLSSHDPNCPTFPFKSWLKSPPLLHDWFDTRRVKDKPAFIYENMTFNPQKYRIEWVYRLLGMLAIQDYDVAGFHYYGHPLPLPNAPDVYTSSPLLYISPHFVWEGTNMVCDEVMMAAVKTAGEIFKRGYLRPAPDPTVVTLGSDDLWNSDSINGGKYGNPARHTVYHKGFRWAFDPTQKETTIDGELISPEEADDESVVRPTDQIAYRWLEGIMVIDAPEAKVLLGFVPSHFIFDGLVLKNIEIHNPEGMPFVIDGERYAGIGITSLDGQPLENSRRILISAANTSWNSGFSMDLEKMAQDHAYVYGLARSITNKGGHPVLIGRVGLTLSAGWLEGKFYKMIDYNENVIAQGKIKDSEFTIPNDLPAHFVEVYAD